MNKVEYIMSNIPDHWKKDNSARLYTVIKALCDEFDIFGTEYNMVDGLLSIDTTYGSDLDKRWGKLFNMDRYVGESDYDYRTRLRVAVSRMIGGTASSIKYAVSNLLKENGQQISDNDVNVVDAWLYTGDAGDIDKSYGNAICVINLHNIPKIDDILLNAILSTIDTVKASGIKISPLFFLSLDDEILHVPSTSFDSDTTDIIVEIIVPDSTETDDNGAIVIHAAPIEDTIDDIIEDMGGYDVYANDRIETTADVFQTNGYGTLNILACLISNTKEPTIISRNEHGSDTIMQDGVQDINIYY